MRWLLQRAAEYSEGALHVGALGVLEHYFLAQPIIGHMKPPNHDNQSQKAEKVDTLPLPVRRGLKKLGEDIALARRRRRISTQSMAERLQVSLKTLQRLEKGDPTVAVGTVATALFVLSELERFTNLLDTASDDVGLSLMDQAVPKRIRRKKPTASSGAL
jgi:DNA-binding XRE family transcriptional regulator